MESGGLRYVFVEFAGKGEDGRKRIHLRFHQITKGAKHDLKAEFLAPVIMFFEKADYVIESVEIVFMLTCHNVTSFELESASGTAFLERFRVFGTFETWAEFNESKIAKYELALSTTQL